MTHYEVIENHQSPFQHLLTKIDHLHKQHKKMSNYDNDVIDYNNVPLKNQLHTQIQQAIIHEPPQSSIAKQLQNQDLTLETFVSSQSYAKLCKKIKKQYQLKCDIVIYGSIITAILILIIIIR